MEKIKSISLYIFLGLLAYMPLHIFLSTWIGTSFGILEFTKVAKDIALVIGFVGVMIVSVRQDWFKELLRDRLVWLVAGYALLTLSLAVIKPTDPDAELLGVVYNLRFLLFFAYGVLLTRLYKSGYVRYWAVRVVMTVALLVLAFGIIQYTVLPDTALKHLGYSRSNGVLPAFFIDDKPDLERIMSTLRDPNSFGSYVIIIFAIAFAYYLVTKNRDLKRLTAGFVALSLLCLWYSFSRSAWIGAAATAGVVVVLYYKNNRKITLQRKYLVLGVSLVVLTALALIPLRNTYFVQNVVFHADESTVLENPNELRQRFWQESLEAAADEPLGYGPGTAGLASIRNDQRTILNENYYLQILHEVGVVGLGLFLAIVVTVGYRLLQGTKDPLVIALFATLIGLAVTNFLVHIWSNEAVAYTWWGLVGLIVTSRVTRRKVVNSKK